MYIDMMLRDLNDLFIWWQVIILKPVQSHTNGGVSDVLKGLGVDSKISLLCNLVVMANTVNRGMNANSIPPHHYATVKLKVNLDWCD